MRLTLKRLITPLLFFTILFVSLGSLGRIAPFDNEVSIYLYEPSLVLTLIALLATYKLKPILHMKEYFVSLRIFFFYVFINYLFLIFNYSLRENFIGFLYLLRLELYILFGIYIFYHFKTQCEEKEKLNISLIIFGVVTVVTAFLQYYLYPDLRNLSYLDWDPHLYRMFGLFFDPFLSAAVYGWLAIFLFFRGETIVKNNYVKFFFLGLLVVIFFLTYSRGAYLALLSSIIFYIVRQKKYVLISLVIVTFALAILLLPKKLGEGINLLRTSTIITRLEDYQKAIQIWQKNPMIGIGYNRIRYEKVQLHKDSAESILRSHAGASFHSSFLIVLVTTGIFGLGFFIYALMQIGRVSDIAMYSTIFLAIFSLTDNVLLHPIILFLYFIGVALSFSPSDKSL